MLQMRAFKFFSFSILCLVHLAISGQARHHFTLSPAPAPAPAPTSDGTTIDQGIACALMLVALAITYLFH
ncbi:hypothetical protein RJT34_04728 [Clitoria ternatea]|uniref:Uncharacterized protein n=1 Tax=Clitoria ternatea TaxID=43366 RepID=A0AAN9Q3P6_CLITE